MASAKEIEWQLHLVKVPTSGWPILWLRPSDASCDAGFVAFDAHFDGPMIFRKKAKLSLLGAEVDSIFQNAQIARSFFLNDAGLLRRDKEKAPESVVLTPHGLAAWNLALVTKETHLPASFKWSRPVEVDDFLRLPALTVWERLQRLLESPDGEAVFARQFALWNEEERCLQIQKPVRGDTSQLHSLLRDLLLSSSVWEQVSTASRLALRTDARNHVEVWDNAASINSDDIEVPPSTKRGVEELWRTFEPFDARVARFLCVQKAKDCPLFVEAERPSAHEQLEAHLRWREWLKEHPP